MKDGVTRDPLEKILRFAGRREAVDPRCAERVERYARERWQSMLARRRAEQRRRRITWIGGGLAIAAGIVATAVLVPRMPLQAPVVATVVNVIGEPAGGARGLPTAPLEPGVELRAGSVLETVSGEGTALLLGSGHSLRLAETTRIRIETDSVMLDSGAIYLDSGVDSRAKPIEVRSRVATVRELGTQYMVRLAGQSLEVSVRKGAVRVEHERVAETARAGEMLRLNASGIPLKTRILEYGHRWAWVAQLASTPDLEGLKLAEFLH